jgi:hypothetical protein
MRTRRWLGVYPAALFFLFLLQVAWGADGQGIPVLRTIDSPHFVYTYASQAPLLVEIRSAETFGQLGLKNQSVDFSKEEVLILGFPESAGGNSCATFRVKGLTLHQGQVVIDKEVYNSAPEMMCNDTGNRPLVAVVIPRQENALPGFQTTLPVKGGFYSQTFYYLDGNIDIDDIRKKMKEAGIPIEGDDSFTSRSYEAVSYIRSVGERFPRAVTFHYPSDNNNIVIGPTPSTFSDGEIKIPEMGPAEASRHLAKSLIAPLFDVPEQQVMDLARECVDKAGQYVFRDWPDPAAFHEDKFRSANGLPAQSDYSVWRRSDVNDYYDTFTESSSQSHLRIHLAHVVFRKQVPGIAEYILGIAEHGRMFIQVVNLEKALSNDELRQGFKEALRGLVDGTPDRNSFRPIYGYSDNEQVKPSF